MDKFILYYLKKEDGQANETPLTAKDYAEHKRLILDQPD
jgi:hypothetical protein